MKDRSADRFHGAKHAEPFDARKNKKSEDYLVMSKITDERRVVAGGVEEREFRHRLERRVLTSMRKLSWRHGGSWLGTRVCGLRPCVLMDD